MACAAAGHLCYKHIGSRDNGGGYRRFLALHDAISSELAQGFADGEVKIQTEGTSQPRLTLSIELLLAFPLACVTWGSQTSSVAAISIGLCAKS